MMRPVVVVHAFMWGCVLSRDTCTRVPPQGHSGPHAPPGPTPTISSPDVSRKLCLQRIVSIADRPTTSASPELPDARPLDPRVRDAIAMSLPLQHLRDAENCLQHTRLRPDDDWPISVPPELVPDFPILLGNIRIAASETPAGFNEYQIAIREVARNRRRLKAHWTTYQDAWSPSRWMHARSLEVYYEDEEADRFLASPLAVVVAEEADERTFFLLWQLCTLYEAGLATTSVELTVVRGAPRLKLAILLQAAAFALDARLDAGLDGGDWIDEDDFDAALAGDRPNHATDAFKALRRLVHGMLLRPTAETGVTLGPDACLETMNGYNGVRLPDVQGNSASAPAVSSSSSSSSLPPLYTAASSATTSSSSCPATPPATSPPATSPPATSPPATSPPATSPPPTEADFDLSSLLESISTSTIDAPRLPAAALSGLREDCRLHPFQEAKPRRSNRSRRRRAEAS